MGYFNIPGRSYIILILIILVIYLWQRDTTPDSGANTGYKEIRERGKIIALTDYSSTSYFIYRGQPMGFQHDLLKMLADHLKLELEIITCNDIRESFEMLNNGECDILAMNLTVTKERSKKMDFTDPISHTKQVLVQRKPKGWEEMSKTAVEDRLIRNQLDLGGKTVYIQKGSSFKNRLNNLSEEIGEHIHIKELDFPTEKLISWVAKGDLEYVVADENVALINSTYYPEIDIKTAVSFPQNLSWAVRKNSRKLLKALNKWIEEMKSSKQYAYIYKKYFVNRKAADLRMKSGYLSIAGGNISDYDDLIRRYSEEIGWDWRLLASLMFQESRFQPNAKSWAGAFGVMQLMPATAQKFGASESSPVEKQIEAGTRFISWLNEHFRDTIENPDERVKFILASYNAGLGHVLDARRLAKKHGKNPDIWKNNVDEFILNKSDPQYFNDPVVKYGYCRGEETYHYVYDIMERYKHYKNAIEAE